MLCNTHYAPCLYMSKGSHLKMALNPDNHALRLLDLNLNCTTAQQRQLLQRFTTRG